MKISLICTILNEEKTIKDLVKSMLSQTRKPDEIVLVDGGSKDRTLKIIKEIQKKNREIKLVVAPGSNIAEGRNIGTRKATGDIVATTDGGCVLDKNWLKNLVKNFPEADVSAGVFKPKAENLFEECEGELVCPDISKLPEDWPPSSRSNAYKKTAWKAVGGYPENLYTAEDSMFNFRLKDAGFKYKIARNAVVYWKMRPTFKSLYRQFFNYGKGDGESLLPFRIFKQTSNINSLKSMTILFGFYIYVLSFIFAFLTGLYALPAALTILLGLYIFFPAPGIYRKTGKPKAFLYVPTINLVRRGAYVLGFHRGLVKR